VSGQSGHATDYGRLPLVTHAGSHVRKFAVLHNVVSLGAADGNKHKTYRVKVIGRPPYRHMRDTENFFLEKFEDAGRQLNERQGGKISILIETG